MPSSYLSAPYTFGRFCSIEDRIDVHSHSRYNRFVRKIGIVIRVNDPAFHTVQESTYYYIRKKNSSTLRIRPSARRVLFILPFAPLLFIPLLLK